MRSERHFKIRDLPETGRRNQKGASQNYPNNPGKKEEGKARVAWVSILITIFLHLNL